MSFPVGEESTEVAHTLMVRPTGKNSHQNSLFWRFHANSLSTMQTRSGDGGVKVVVTNDGWTHDDPQIPDIMFAQISMTHPAVASPPERRTVSWASLPRWLAIAALAALGAQFFWTRALRYTDLTASTYGHHWDHRWWLVAHIGGGSLALLLGPAQFSSALRRWSLTVHRWTGRLYLTGVAVGTVAATYVGVVEPRRAFGWSLVAMAFAWLTTSSMAYLAIRRRRVAAHREWMIRSYVVTYGFVVFRALLSFRVIAALGPEAITVDAWLCWAIPLLGMEVALQWQRTVG
jgi:hypothetical protein